MRSNICSFIYSILSLARMIFYSLCYSVSVYVPLMRHSSLFSMVITTINNGETNNWIMNPFIHTA